MFLLFMVHEIPVNNQGKDAWDDWPRGGPWCKPPGTSTYSTWIKLYARGDNIEEALLQFLFFFFFLELWIAASSLAEICGESFIRPQGSETCVDLISKDLV